MSKTCTIDQKDIMRNKKDYLWNIIGRFVPQVLYLGSTMILARILTPDDFGKVGVLAIFISIANTLVDCGLGGSLIKEKKISELDCSTISSFNLLISLSIYTILFFTAPYIELMFKTEGLSLIVRTLSLFFVINSCGLIPNTLLIRDLRFKVIMVRNIIATSVGVIVALITAFCDGGVFALVGYQLTVALVTVVISFYITGYKLSFKFDFKCFRRLISFGVFTTISSVIDSIYENIITFLFGKFLGLKQAGYIDQSKKLETSVTQTITATVNSVSFPILTKLRDELPVFIKECEETTKTISFILFPILCIIAIYSKPIIEIVYGPKWIEASTYLSLLIYAGIFLILESLYRNYVKSLTKVKDLMLYTLYKRFVAIGIIVLFLMVNANYLLYGYILGAFVGLLFNIALFAKCINIRLMYHLVHLLRTEMAPLSLLLLFIIVANIISSELLSLIVTISLCAIFYLIYLPKLGINIKSLFKSKD